MSDKIECPSCAGCGWVDSIDKLPWTIAGRNSENRAEIRSGKRTHIACPQCGRSGEIDKPEEKQEQQAENKE